MRQVALVGAGMTRFGKHVDRSMKDLAREAIEGALQSTRITPNGHRGRSRWQRGCRLDHRTRVYPGSGCAARAWHWWYSGY